MAAIAQQARPSRTTCLLVARKGKVVGEWNWRDTDPETPREVFSVTKSITSTLVGMAQADGDLDIDQPAKRYIEEWRGTKSRDGDDPRHPQQRQRPLLGRRQRLRQPAPGRGPHRSTPIDLKQQYPPGRVWAYNNAAIQTLDRVISTATGEPTREYAAERLFGPIGMTHTQMTPDPAGNTNAFFGTQTTCEDLARFGYLFLRQGRWGDEQVVPRSWVKAAVGQPSQPHSAAYGLLWWLNRRGPIIGPLATDAPGQPEPPVGQTMPGMPANAYTAQGLGGQMVLVDPRSETVVVRIGEFQASPRDTYTGQDAARFVTEALVGPSDRQQLEVPEAEDAPVAGEVRRPLALGQLADLVGLGVVGVVLGQPAGVRPRRTRTRRRPTRPATPRARRAARSPRRPPAGPLRRACGTRRRVPPAERPRRVSQAVTRCRRRRRRDHREGPVNGARPAPRRTATAAAPRPAGPTPARRRCRRPGPIRPAGPGRR